MTELPDAVIGNSYKSLHSWDVLNDLVAIGNRMAGHKGEKKGATIVEDALSESGIHDVMRTEFDIHGWWRSNSRLTVESFNVDTSADYDVIALPGSPSDNAKGRLVNVGYGTPEEFESANVEDAIAVSSSDTPDNYGRWIHRMEKYVLAIKHGASGFVFMNHVPGCLPPTGEVGYDARPAPIPAVGISAELGAQLSRIAETNGSPMTELSVDCKVDRATSVNVEGTLGPESGEEILFTAHVDAHDISEGANDNGAGTAIVAEVARILASIEDDLQTGVRFIIFGAEEIGLRGAYHWANSHDLSGVKAIVNVDGAGYSNDLRLMTSGFDQLSETLRGAAGEFSVPVTTYDDVHPHADQWAMVQEGVPGVMAGSKKPDGGRGYGHTHADTLEKVDPRDLRDLSIALAEGLLHLGDPTVTTDHVTVGEMRERSEPFRPELEGSNRWPFDG
jgi:Zn-dependent M28 family amino/carboxypeptidase